MSSKYELPIATTYVADWSISDAIRELFQNALDQEVQNPTNKFTWAYNPATTTLSICNKAASLTKQSLLLGNTTKAQNTDTIGQFGEGYKLAALVLLRNNLTMTIYNYDEGEIWEPRLVKSRRFGAEILTFFVSKYKWTDPPSNDLTIEVQGITPDIYEHSLKKYNLHMNHNYPVIKQTRYGEILPKEYDGYVFVNGLYVCRYEPYKYGYNFKVGQLTLDRDRKLASDFDLRWAASKMWAASGKTDTVVELIEENAADVAYLLQSSYENRKEIANYAWSKFVADNGPHAVPVTTNEELNSVLKGFRGVIVEELHKAILSQSDNYRAPCAIIETPLDKLHAWVDMYAEDLGKYLDNEQSDRVYDSNIIMELTDLIDAL